MTDVQGQSHHVATPRREARPALAIFCSVSMIFLLFAAPVLSTNASADDPPKGNGPQLGDRAVNVTNNNGLYVIRSSTVIKGVEDSFKVELFIGEDFQVALKYKENSKESEHRIDVTLKFMNIVEFDDRNNDGRYQPSEEIQLYRLDNRSLGPIEYRTENGPARPVHVLTASTHDKVFTMVFYMTGEFTKLFGQNSQVNMTPSEVKFDIMIRGFHFKDNASRLALDGQIITNETLQFDNQTIDEKLKVARDESGCVFNDRENIAGAFLSWANWAMVDGQKRPIQMDIPPATMVNETKRLTINYPRGADIFHDPKMGVLVNPIKKGGNDWAWRVGSIVAIGTALSVVSVVVGVDRSRFQRKAAKQDPFELNDYPHYKGKR